ncbi:MAG: hypothetical protein HY554_03565 [Elusimicrobia bacterium]|nr:hypothetical protein [Elusimicrobiota bacterium]
MMRHIGKAAILALVACGGMGQDAFAGGIKKSEKVLICRVQAEGISWKSEKFRGWAELDVQWYANLVYDKLAKALEEAGVTVVSVADSADSEEGGAEEDPKMKAAMAQMASMPANVQAMMKQNMDMAKGAKGGNIKSSEHRCGPGNRCAHQSAATNDLFAQTPQRKLNVRMADTNSKLPAALNEAGAESFIVLAVHPGLESVVVSGAAYSAKGKQLWYETGARGEAKRKPASPGHTTVAESQRMLSEAADEAVARVVAKLVD